MTAERASVVSATRIVGSGPASGVRVGGVMIGVAAEGGVQTGCVRLGRVSSRVCCWAIARGRTSDCTSSKAITLRIVADSTTKPGMGLPFSIWWNGTSSQQEHLYLHTAAAPAEKPLGIVLVQFAVEAFRVQPLGCCFGKQA